MELNTTLLQSLADPTRFRILETLKQGECSVNDIVKQVDIKQSGVSRHLHILLEAGIVKVRPDGQKRLYSLCPEPFLSLDAWLNGYRALWEARLDRFGDALKRLQEANTPPKKEDRS